MTDTQETDVLIVGAGPNALSLATHLHARGVEHRILGSPMKFWRELPPGLNLKSPVVATNICPPRAGFTLSEWLRAHKPGDAEPCPMEAFAAYGMWCVEELVPYVEETEVAFVAARNGGFEITTDAGETQRARRLVLATGLSGLKRIPESLAHLPPELASHTFDNHSYRRYDGMRVAVIGAGASAIEAAVLVHDAGGTATVLVRGDRVIFHGKTDARRSLYQRLRHPDSVLGPGPRNWALEKFPMALHAFPIRFRVPFVKRFLGPASPWWIKERADAAVSVVLGTRVTKAEAIGSGVRLTVRHSGGDDELMEVDHVVCGTGYTFDLDRLGYLDAALCSRMRRVETAPALSRHFESSVPGAYFIGPIAAMSFGPLFRFAAGAEVSAPTVARHLARGSRRAIRL